jgi:hypothetical protein
MYPELRRGAKFGDTSSLAKCFIHEYVFTNKLGKNNSIFFT